MCLCLHHVSSKMIISWSFILLRNSLFCLLCPNVEQRRIKPLNVPSTYCERFHCFREVSFNGVKGNEIFVSYR